MSEQPTRYVAERIVQTAIGDAEAEAIRIAKDTFFDTVGCMLVGSREPWTAEQLADKYREAAEKGCSRRKRSSARQPSFAGSRISPTCVSWAGCFVPR